MRASCVVLSSGLPWWAHHVPPRVFSPGAEGPASPSQPEAPDADSEKKNINTMMDGWE